MPRSRRLLLWLIASLAACSSAGNQTASDASQRKDARGEGLSFRDTAASPDLPPMADGAHRDVPADVALQKPDGKLVSPCPSQWSAWDCKGTLFGCTATCEGKKYELDCTVPGACQCTVAGKQRACPLVPFPPGTLGCDFCSLALATSCCQPAP